MSKKISFILFGLIIVVAIILRFWQLGHVPPSPDWDEASLGYNAYSILTSGKDEYGKFLPVILRSFDDYKPALYAYLIIPFIKIFGLTLFAVRMPGAIAGVFGVIGVYFLVKELFKNKYSEHLALLSAFIFAISPWDLQFSRIAFEAQVGMVLNLYAVLFFIKGLRKGWLLCLSAIFASLSIYIYQSEKVFLPILFLVLVIIYFKDLIKIPKTWLITSIIVGIIICLPMIFGLLGDSSALTRAKGVSVFADQTVFLKENAQKNAFDRSNHDFLGILLDNRRVEFVKAITAGYISHFSLNWLFITGDIERHHAPGMGLLYLFELPFILIGIFKLLFGDYSKKTKLTIFAIFLIAPIPASITSGVPHAVRTINFLPTWQIFSAIGLLTTALIVSDLKIQKSLRYVLYTIAILFFVFNFSYYLNQYFVQQNYYDSQDWQYGYQQAIDYIKPIQSNYKQIVVTNQPPLDQSYIFFLYYLKYDPKAYQDSGGTGTGGFRENHKGFANFTFRPIDWNNEPSGSLIIGRPKDIPDNAKILEKVDYLDGTGAIEIAQK